MLWDHPFLFTLLVDFLIQFAHSVGAGHLDVGDFVVRFSLFSSLDFCVGIRDFLGRSEGCFILRLSLGAHLLPFPFPSATATGGVVSFEGYSVG
jgi:hypothetical protein